MNKFSPKVAHAPNGHIGSPSPSTSLGILDILDAMNSLPTINETRHGTSSGRGVELAL